MNIDKIAQRVARELRVIMEENDRCDHEWRYLMGDGPLLEVVRQCNHCSKMETNPPQNSTQIQRGLKAFWDLCGDEK